MGTNALAFVQFRRLLVGVVVEILQGSGIEADLAGLTADFASESGFRFLWFDNWMRFRGSVRVPLRAPVEVAQRQALGQRFQGVWPEIVGALGSMPLADRLDIVRNEVEVALEDEKIVIRFDLEAD